MQSNETILRDDLRLTRYRLAVAESALKADNPLVQVVLKRGLYSRYAGMSELLNLILAGSEVRAC